ncbi:MAG: hypothetical protein AB3N17_18225 [Tateyamaria sp.]
MIMKAELNREVIWCLRALAQNADIQRELYPTFVVVADELVLDFDEAYSDYKAYHQTQHADLDNLDTHIASKSGILEFWTDEALDDSEFWSEIRNLAKKALISRNLTTFAPHPSTGTFVSASETWTAGSSEFHQSNSKPASVVARLLKLFR